MASFYCSGTVPKIFPTTKMLVNKFFFMSYINVYYCLQLRASNMNSIEPKKVQINHIMHAWRICKNTFANIVRTISMVRLFDSFAPSPALVLKLVSMISK